MTTRLRRTLPYVATALLSLAALTAIIAAHLYSPDNLPLLLSIILHSLHGPGFVAVALVVFAALRFHRRRTINYRYAAIVVFMIGLVSEVAQSLGSRTASISDLVVDSIAIVGALGALALFDRDARAVLRARTLAGLATVSGVALLYSLGPTAWYGYAWLEQQRVEPQILTFDKLWERQIYHHTPGSRVELLDAPASWPIEGTVASVKTNGRRPQLDIWPIRDWRDYDSLTFLAATADGSTQELRVIINDLNPRTFRDRRLFVKFITIDPVPQRFSIPISDVQAGSWNKPVDIAHVARIGIRPAERDMTMSFIIDDFRLDKSPSGT